MSVTASLPCYDEKNVAEQRGKGVFARSIDALQKLNSLGYGIVPGLPLNLVYNPKGAFLPPDNKLWSWITKRDCGRILVSSLISC